MRNPWLDIAEVDYVGHMSSPAVNQRPVLSRLLRDALESAQPGTPARPRLFDRQRVRSLVRQAFLDYQPLLDGPGPFPLVRVVIVGVFFAIVAWIVWASR